MRIGPRSPVQRAYCASTADWKHFGGAAGSGKTAAMMLQPLYRGHYRRPGWRGVVLRRKLKDGTQTGGLWDEAPRLWSPTGARLRQAPKSAEWSSGARIDFNYPETGGNYEAQYQGLQASWLGFDEWTHFDWDFVSYVWGRMRSPIGVRPEVCGTSNPDPDSWLLSLVQPYLDDAGYPRRELSGRHVYFAVHAENDELVVERTRRACRIRARATDAAVWSFAFFPATAADNAYMIERNPAYVEEYEAKVGSTRVRRERLVRGNWYVRDQVGGALREANWDICTPDDVPHLVARVRCWDRAYSKPREGAKPPDYSGSVLCGWDVNGRFYAGLGDRGVVALRDEPKQRVRVERLTALHDGPSVVQRFPIDPAGGKDGEAWTREKMAGPGIGRLDFFPQPSSSSKVVRAQPLMDALADRAEGVASRCSFVRGPWADRVYQDAKVKTTLWRLLWSHLDPFPDGDHDDLADCVSGAFNARGATRPYVGLGAEGWAQVVRLRDDR